MRWEMLAIERRNSLKRLGPSPSITITRTLHLSPTPVSAWLTTQAVLGHMQVTAEIVDWAKTHSA